MEAISASYPEVQAPAAPAPSAPEPTLAPAPASPDASEAPKPDTTPKTGIDAIPDLAAPAAEPEAEKQPEQPVSPQKAKWEELRTKASELDKLKPEVEQLRQKLQELETKPQVPEDLTRELDELRQFRFATEVETTPEWQEGVSQPWNEVIGQFKEIAEYYGVDVEELVAKADDTNSLKRGAAIREYLASSDKDVSPEVLAIATDAAKRLHGVYAKMQELKDQSAELYQSIEAKRTLETEKQKAEREQAYSTSRNSIYETLAKKMPDVFKNPDLAKAVKEAAPSEDPLEQAYQAVSATVLPEVAKQLRDAKAEIARLEKIISGRSNAAPGLGTPPPQADPNKPQEMTLDEALRASGLRF
jgi:DNA repair exonuclease SbcCD ATPase subunit